MNLRHIFVAAVAVSFFGCEQLAVEADEDHIDTASTEQEIVVRYPKGKELQALADLNLRAEPNRDARLLKVIPQWRHVFTAREGGGINGYYQVEFAGTVGWAFGPYLQSESSGSEILKWGLYPDASDALKKLEITPGEIAQTIGNAPASAGTHLADGSANGQPYGAATDIWISGLNDSQVRHLLEGLGMRGFAAWCRGCGNDGWSGPRHIHAIYAGTPQLKDSLQNQVQSWLVGRDGLVGNRVYGFYQWSAEAKDRVRRNFSAFH